MVVPVEVIERYLQKPPQRVGAFKGVNVRQLYAIMYNTLRIPFQPPKTPYRGKHQLEGVAFSLALQRAILFYDPRLGKSWCALMWAEHLKRAGLWQGKGLIIVHAPIGLDVWEHEVPTHSSLKISIVRTKLEEFISALEDDSDLIAIPWSGLQNIFTSKQRTRVHKLDENRKSKFVYENKRKTDLELIDLVVQGKPFSLAIVDEIHMAKTKQTLRFKIATALLQDCAFRLGLTGTPFGRNPFDLWAQAFLIDGGKALGTNFNFFREAFGKVDKKNKLVFDSAKEPILRAKMAPLALSCQRSEVHDVNIMTGEIILHMHGEQKAAYERAIDHIIEISGTQQEEIKTSFIRLRQISSGYLPFVTAEGEQKVMTFGGNPKLEWLREFVQINPGTQLIIFHEFIRSGELICSCLKENDVSHAWLHGGVSNTKEIVQGFNSGKYQYLVANSAKGGMSIDLPQANYILFWESPTSPTTRQQAEARPMSRGSQLLTIDDMLASGVEKKILNFIKEGKDLLQSLVHYRKQLRD